jgi:methionyl-tRNA formyltransferase
MQIGVLCSGNLGFDCLKKIHSEKAINCVLTDKKSQNIINFCQNLDIPLFVGNPRDGKGFDFMKNIQLDLVLSINYLFLIDNDIINYLNNNIVNIHGSLLPKYRGRTPHVWAIINNEVKTGITAHFIDENCDTGDIIEQIEIPIDYDFTGQDLLNVFNLYYYELLKKVIVKFESKKISRIKQNHTLATYFSKRTPEDGLINWNWQKEQIYNWVRALSYPYPGAFSFYNGEKIIIDKVKFCNFGFSDNQINGTILNLENNPIIKTPNGAIELITIRNFDKKQFKLNSTFDEK